ncbi:kelch-like protein 2 [Octopus bimaculoides]|nr:kelch-like protein 2 [Octopus bimaculoides]XP_029634855.1 kelch-like protein 2 [Octopus sinensis]XP_036357840.1 kelch-like protein 2 [Octopus sinensis]XP_036357841.1 kelch-like protein 2 [Octopus sinensis]XP_052822809.1 kelch-like protein 2 [Octopus bimaculoides]|eukprot:XP_014770021.1 PREDICTED: kelch-like protein 2 [Octopus bimaculoides]
MDIRRPKMLAGREHPAYKNKQHSEQAFEKLNQMRKMGKLCDVTLLAGDTEILAHRAVLASCSPYFYAMFNAEMAESKAEKVTLHQIDPAALSMLIDFVYTSEIHVTEDNVQTLLPASNLLQLTEVQEACCEFLQSQLHPSNCLGIKDFADLHDCTELLNYTQTYIEQHFSEVVYYDEFLSLTACQVSKLIASDRLTVPSEEQVFEAVLSWIEHDTENRQLSIAELMEHVRLPLMSQEFLVQRVECEPMIKSNTQCKDLLIEAMKYHLLKAEQKALFKTPRTLPRTPIGLPKVLLVLGGQAPKAIKSVECYDFKEERWYQLAEMPIRRCRCGVAVVNGLVYVVGGFSGSLRVRTVDAYDPVKDVWITCQSMKARRSTLGVALLNDLIYAVGGFDGSSGLDGAECYDVKTGLWKSVAPMSIRRSSVGVGVVGGFLYAVGGYDGCSRQCLSTVEYFDPEANCWHPAAEMSCRRSGAGVGVVDGLLYAVGGHDGPLVRKSVEVYNPQTNTWSLVADMHFCRRNAGVVTNEGLLYVIGGDDGSSNLGSIECYDAKLNKWTLLPSCMVTGRSYAGVVVIDKPIT